MNRESTIISLEILLLNDLLHSKAIDKELYDQASSRIISISQPTPIPSNHSAEAAAS